MKRKIWLLIVSLFSLFCGFVSAQSITFDVQWDWEFGYGCIVPIDVYVDTQWQTISAIDLIFESSMKYKDFENTDNFPYFFPPLVKENGLVHIIWFTVDESERFKWAWKIGTLYFQQKDNSADGAVRLYFLWEWETIDTNLSIAWGIDVLKQVWDAFVKFSRNLPKCDVQQIESDLSNIDGYADKDFEGSLNETLNQVAKDHPSPIWGIISKSNMKSWIFVVCGCIILIVIILVIYKILSNKKESSKWSI